MGKRKFRRIYSLVRSEKMIEFKNLSEDLQEKMLYNDLSELSIDTDTWKDGRVIIQHIGSLYYDHDNVEYHYTYSMDWTGYDDGEDGGEWSFPYDIEREIV